jgi:transporter family-2 protein
MQNMIYAFPFIAGLCICLQGTINSHWESRVGVHVTIFINGLIVAVVTGLFFLLANRTPIERIISEIRPWIVVNGICGCIILLIAALTFSRIGAASVIVLMVSGQLITALVFDHFGVLSLPQQPLSMMRLAGIAFVVVGVLLTTRG